MNKYLNKITLDKDLKIFMQSIFKKSIETENHLIYKIQENVDIVICKKTFDITFSYIDWNGLLNEKKLFNEESLLDPIFIFITKNTIFTKINVKNFRTYFIYVVIKTCYKGKNIDIFDFIIHICHLFDNYIIIKKYHFYIDMQMIIYEIFKNTKQNKNIYCENYNILMDILCKNDKYKNIDNIKCISLHNFIKEYCFRIFG